MKYKVVIIGNGAREHAIGEALMRSEKHEVELFVYGSAKNPGLSELSTGYELGSVTDLDAIAMFVRNVQPDFVIPGPEAPIAEGVVDRLAQLSIPCVAPTKAVAQLESSKGFARDLLEKYGIEGNPKYRVFKSDEGMTEYVNTELSGEFVVKADGLKGGKGVKVMGDHFSTVDEGLAYAKQCIEADGHVVIEEKLVGEEFSLMAFVDGDTVLPMIPVQDHKRAFDGDKGPNTGGMGSYSDANHSLPFLTQEDIDAANAINEAVVKAVKEETGQPMRGILFGGFMAVKKGVRLIEYNVRFGDPESENVLSLLKTDFVEICLAAVNGGLRTMTLEFKEKASVCLYAVPEGYPDSPAKEVKIEMQGEPAGVETYYSSVDRRVDGLYLMGSRAIAFVGTGDDLQQAQSAAAEALKTVQGPIFYRTDIGTKALIQQRVSHMKRLRG